MELTFCELRQKEVVNTCDGKKLGHVIDIVFCYPAGNILGIVVPGVKNSFFKCNEDIFIDFKKINKIGDDVVLVNISNKITENHDDNKNFDDY